MVERSAVGPVAGEAARAMENREPPVRIVVDADRANESFAIATSPAVGYCCSGSTVVRVRRKTGRE
jgi:hypothetical protein